MTVLDDELARALGPEFEPLGFERVRPRRWVGGTAAPIRQLFEFYALTPLRYTARWGWSLDFVPQLRAGRLCWKRTSKSAAFDLCIDPIDEFGGVPAWCSISLDPVSAKPSRDRVKNVAANTSIAALRDFGRVTSVQNVVALFGERSKMRYRRFSLKNYVQTDIAWGLALIAIGRSEEGEVRLRAYREHFRVRSDDPLLRKAELVAAAYAARDGRSDKVGS